MKVSVGPGEIINMRKGWMTTNGGGKVTQMRRTDAGWIMPILIVFSLVTLVTSLVFFFEGPHPQFSMNVFKDLVARIVHIGPGVSDQDPSNHIDPAQYESKQGILNAMISVDVGNTQIDKGKESKTLVVGTATEEEEDAYGRGKLRRWSKKTSTNGPFESPLFEQEEEEVEVHQSDEPEKKEEDLFEFSKQFASTTNWQEQTTKQKKRLERILDQFDSFVDGKEFIVFQVDNRALPIMLRGESYTKSSFNMSAFGPSALSLARWARQHNYAYIMNLSQSPFPDPYKLRTMTFFWQKVPPFIILMRLAMLSNERKLIQQQQQQQDKTTRNQGSKLIKGIVFADTDVFPHEYLPKWLSANSQARWYKQSNTNSPRPREQPSSPNHRDSTTNEGQSSCSPRIVSFKEDATMMSSNVNASRDSSDNNNNNNNNRKGIKTFVDLDEFLETMPKPHSHIYIAKGHSSSEGWLRNGIKYPSSVWVPIDEQEATTSNNDQNQNHANTLFKEIEIPSVNGGMFLARPTETALEILREWYLQSSKRTSLEMNTVRFTVKTNRSTSESSVPSTPMDELINNTLVDVGDNVLANSNTHEGEMEVLVKVLRWMRSVRKENQQQYLLEKNRHQQNPKMQAAAAVNTVVVNEGDSTKEIRGNPSTTLVSAPSHEVSKSTPMTIKTQQQLRGMTILDETMIDLVDEHVCTPFAIRERKMLSTTKGEMLPTFSLMCRGVNLEVINKHFKYFCDKGVDERIDCFKRTFRNFLNVWPAEQGKMQWLILRSIAREEGNSVFYLSHSPALSTPDQFFPNKKQHPLRKTRVFYHVATATGMRETSLAVSRILMQETHPDKCILNEDQWEKEAWDLFRKIPAFKLSFKKSFVEIERRLFGIASSSSSSLSEDELADEDDDDKLLEMFNI